VNLASKIGEQVPLSSSHQVGPWRIVRPLGRGGMGTVYEAERRDGEVVQRAAVKFVPLSLRSDVILERFRQERQILADLNHPNISRLIDAGTTEDRSPYLVMELIEGQPIDAWCAERHLDPQQIVALFQKVCAAVQHAHQHLVIHRDLKPQNILVTAAGEPKLLDFGIAKLLDPAQGGGETTLHAMTPDYASPEQLEGRPMNTATDIFSLGCVLYKLLTAEPPRRDTNTARHITLPRASLRRPELRGDLDNILNKCLQPEPERRYSSVEQFNRDLRRFLNHEPVSATSDSWTYITLRFLRRHRLSAVAVAALLISIAAGSLISVWQARRAERRFQELRQLANAFVFQFEQQIRDISGTTRARQFVVRTAIGYLERLAAESGGDPGLQLELAAAYRKISEVQFDPSAGSLGDLNGARESLARAEALAAQVPDAGVETIRLLLRRSEMFEAGGKLAESLNTAQQAQKLSDSLLRDSPADEKWRELGSLAAVRLARAWRRHGNLDESLRSVQRAVSLDRMSVAQDPGARDPALRLSSSLRLLARVHQARQNLPDAVSVQREANQILENVRQSSGEGAAVDRSIMVGRSLLGSLLQDASSLKEATLLLADAYRAAERRATSDPVDSRAQRDLQAVAIRYASVLLDARRPAEGRAVLERALLTSRQLLQSDPLDRESKLNYGIALAWLAAYAPASALQARQDALALYQELLRDAPSDPDVLSPFLLNAADLAPLLDKTRRAELCRQALSVHTDEVTRPLARLESICNSPHSRAAP